MVDIPSYIGIPLLVLFIVMIAFYSSTETAFACLNKYKFKVEAEDGNKTAKLVLRLYDHFDTTLISVLIGNNVFAILLSFVSTFMFMNWFQNLLDDYWISLIASIAMAILTFLFGDTIPKLIAKNNPDRLVRFNVYPLVVFVALFYPLSLIFRGLSFLVKKIFRLDKAIEVTEEDLTSAIEDAEEAGLIEENESDLLQATLEFDDTTVKEVLTPKKRMQMIDLEGLTTEQLLNTISQSKYSRLPLYWRNKDHVVGVLMVKNYLSAYLSNPKTTNYMAHVQKPYFVTPSVKIDNLLEGFRKNHTHIAIVRSKDGKLIGMVTLEDVLEELVGGMQETGKEYLLEAPK